MHHCYQHFPQFVLFLWQARCTSLSFLFSLISTLCSTGTAMSTIRLVLFFFSRLSLGLVAWPGFRDLFAFQNLRESCVSLCPRRFINIPFGTMVRYKFLAKFTVDHLPDSLRSSLEHNLLENVAFVYVTDRFVFICFFIASCLFKLLHSLYGDVLCCY